MKTVFTLLLATIFSSAAFAYEGSRLSVSVAAKGNLQVVIDGRSYNDDDNAVVVNNIQPGQHTIRVYKDRRNSNANGYGRANRNNNSNELLFSTTVYVKPATDVDVMINRFGKALVDEQAIRNNGRYGNNDDYYSNDRDRGYDNRNGGYGNDRNGNYGNSYNQAMSDYDFNQLVQKIKGQWFGNQKASVAKDAFTQSYFNTAQVRQILLLINGESDRLELAKLAFRNTVDQRSYYQLYDVLQLQSSRDELDRYVKDYRY